MTQHLKVYGGGKIAIPASYRRALGIDDGDMVVIDMTDGELRVRSTAALVRDAQALVRQYVAPETSLVDELIAERRAEAARE